MILSIFSTGTDWYRRKHEEILFKRFEIAMIRNPYFVMSFCVGSAWTKTNCGAANKVYSMVMQQINTEMRRTIRQKKWYNRILSFFKNNNATK